MDITLAALIGGGTATVTFIVWLVRLEGKALQVEKDLARETKDTDDRFNAANGVFTLIQGDIRELQIRAISRDDLKETKQELTESINAVGNRMDAKVDQLVSVISKKSTTRPATPRVKP